MLGRLFKSVTQKSAAPARPDYRAPEGRRIYAIGDIHGRADLLQDIHDQIRRDGEAAGDVGKVVVYLGDYVDRGMESRQVIETLLGEPLPGFQCVHLLGNHEAMMLDFYDSGANGMMWLYNGGNATLHSYGIAVKPNIRDDEELADAAAALRGAIPPAHVEFLRNLQLYHVEGDYLFVHAGIRPGLALEDQDSADLIWIRRNFTESGEDFGRLVVHGHTITGDIDARANRIGIDTGAYASGILTCLILQGADRHYIQT